MNICIYIHIYIYIYIYIYVHPELGHITSLTELFIDGNPLRPPLADAFEEEGMEGIPARPKSSN